MTKCERCNKVDLPRTRTICVVCEKEIELENIRASKPSRLFNK